MDGTENQTATRRSAAFWGTAFLAGTFGVAGASLVLDLNPGLSAALFLAGMLLLIPFVRSAERAQRLRGTSSPALRRYSRRMMVASFAYVAALMGAVWLSKSATFPTPALVALALAPAIPVIGMIWAMARLLVEEDDEYLRSRHVHHALVATGFVLALGTTWGFLEQFGLVPHVPAYWVFPGWAIGLGLSQAWSAVRS